MFTIFRDFRQLVEAVMRLVNVIQQLVEVQQQAGPAVDRLEALELSRHHFEAMCEGTYLKAEGKLKAALNAEARERQIKKHNDRLADPLADDGEEVAEEARDAVLDLDAQAGEAQRVPALRVGVASDRKAAALMAKWSR